MSFKIMEFHLSLDLMLILCLTKFAFRSQVILSNQMEIHTFHNIFLFYLLILFKLYFLQKTLLIYGIHGPSFDFDSI